MQTLRTWLQEAAWPLWLEHGIDRARGGFFEALDLNTKRCAAPYRRLRVLARQIYVFSEAHREGLAGADEAVALGLSLLRRHAAQPDGGYAWRFDLAHQPIDLTRDLYDHAFVLLALSSATLVHPADSLRAEALALVRYIDAHFTDPAGGYIESLPPQLPRRQNPHMHYFEALLAAYEAFGDAVFLARAASLADLFETRLFDAESGALPEYFDPHLKPLREQQGFLVEPGHHCEWMWLLHRFSALAGTRDRLAEIAARLMQFVDRHGVNPAYGVVDGLASNGHVLQGGLRLWPQTERLKAAFLRPDRTPEDKAHAVQSLAAFLRPDGLWHERRTADGVFSHEPAPASSLYHLTCAILTVHRRTVF